MDAHGHVVVERMELKVFQHLRRDRGITPAEWTHSVDLHIPRNRHTSCRARAGNAGTPPAPPLSGPPSPALPPLRPPRRQTRHFRQRTTSAAATPEKFASREARPACRAPLDGRRSCRRKRRARPVYRFSSPSRAGRRQAARASRAEGPGPGAEVGLEMLVGQESGVLSELETVVAGLGRDFATKVMR